MENWLCLVLSTPAYKKTSCYGNQNREVSGMALYFTDVSNGDTKDDGGKE